MQYSPLNDAHPHNRLHLRGRHSQSLGLPASISRPLLPATPHFIVTNGCAYLIEGSYLIVISYPSSETPLRTMVSYSAAIEPRIVLQATRKLQLDPKALFGEVLFCCQHDLSKCAIFMNLSFRQEDTKEVLQPSNSCHLRGIPRNALHSTDFEYMEPSIEGNHKPSLFKIETTVGEFVAQN